MTVIDCVLCIFCEIAINNFNCIFQESPITSVHVVHSDLTLTMHLYKQLKD